MYWRSGATEIQFAGGKRLAGERQGGARWKRLSARLVLRGVIEVRKNLLCILTDIGTIPRLNLAHTAGNGRTIVRRAAVKQGNQLTVEEELRGPCSRDGGIRVRSSAIRLVDLVACTIEQIERIATSPQSQDYTGIRR